MWVKFPKGQGTVKDPPSVQIEQQDFKTEAMVKDDVDPTVMHFYTRVPDHFVPRLQSVGFVVETPRETDLQDLPPGSESLSIDMKNMATEIEGLRGERTALQEEVKRLNAVCTAVTAERDTFEADYRKAAIDLQAITQERDGMKSAKDAAEAELATAKGNLEGIHATLAERGIDLTKPADNGGAKGK